MLEQELNANYFVIKFTTETYNFIFLIALNKIKVESYKIRFLELHQEAQG